MVTIGSLWLAILLSSVLVFIASSIVWMVLPHHKSDYRAFPNESAVADALRGLSPGQYDIPHMTSMSDMKDPVFTKKFEEGPVGVYTAWPNGQMNMGKSLVLSFIFYAVVSFVVAYLTSRTLAPGIDYLQVFRVAGTTAWLAYGFAVIPEAIWFGRPWSLVVKNLLDALLYALLTAGVFGWLWPGV